MIPDRRPDLVATDIHPTTIPRHVVMFSGGICSFCAAKRVIGQHGTDGVVLLFADTLIEDEDLYRFLGDAETYFGVPITRIAHGKTPWELFDSEHMIGNNGVAICSRKLKRELLDRWRDEHCDPATTMIHVGLDSEELHRWERMQTYVAPWMYSAPMTERPLVSRGEMLDIVRACGIKPPRLYELGFAHNNCGGFCVRAGQGAFIHLLKTMPCRFAYHEQKEREFREKFGKDVAILKHRSGPKKGQALTLRELREKWEGGQRDMFDVFDIGGCGCATD